MNLGGGRVETRALGKVYQTARDPGEISPALITEADTVVKHPAGRIRFVPEKGTPTPTSRVDPTADPAARFDSASTTACTIPITSVRSRSR